MSENKEITNETNQKVASNKLVKKLKRTNRILKVVVVILLLACICLTALFVRNTFFRGQTISSTEDKITEALNIMENEWYFGKDIDDLDERLLNQALTGITTNEEDKHTYYMTSEEVKSFIQGINRNFVGIGVQFISTNGINMIQRVFKGSPAENAGVQAGDIIHSVDGTVVDNMSSTNIADLVKGEEGTTVHIEFIRDGETIPIDIVRGQISATVYGEVKDGIGYIEILQFGESTASEVKLYLEDFIEQGIKDLIIDLRDDGGGYLTALQSVGGLFLGKDKIALIEEDSSGKQETLKFDQDQIWNSDGEIVLLVNGNTASAAEAFTLAMKEQRSNVTIVGTTTYGKGTVQVTEQFKDGSAIKYTTSKWLSSSETWVNGVGIEPDTTVELPEIISTTITQLDEDTVYEYDSVSDEVKIAQLSLEYLGYEVDRKDGYFSNSTTTAITTFQKDHSLEETGKLDKTTYESIISAVTLDWNTTDTHDTQLHYAEDLING
jgi:carboxyl-terminal processing protease